MDRDGKVGKPTTDCISVHLPKGYKQHLSKIAYKEDKSLTKVMKRAIEEYAKREHKIDLKEAIV